jgi:anti-sigma factor RsiW
VSKRAHALADVLGDANDLHMLREYVETHPQCFEDEASKAALQAVIDRRTDALRDEALRRGRKLYKRSPKRFVKQIERGWAKRAPERPQPLAG